MTRGRLEAFSDGVVAIIITIMVLELKIPHEADAEALRSMLPGFLTYALSFIYLGIYWVNHHHMLHTVEHMNGKILWANLHLLFWLSLVPTATAWMGENHTLALPTAIYGAILLLAAVAYTMLQATIIGSQGPHSRLAAAIGGDRKGKASLFLYASALVLAFVQPWMSDALFVVVAVIWLVPDRRIENTLVHAHLAGD